VFTYQHVCPDEDWTKEVVAASTCGCGCTCGCGWFAEEVDYVNYEDEEESKAKVQGSRWQFIRL
jgi:hypothetical protein